MTDTATITVALGTRSYPIHIGRGVSGDAAKLNPLLGAGGILVVTDEHVAPHYLQPMLAMLAPGNPGHIVLRAGEAHKKLSAVADVLDALVEKGCGRDATVIALGGGVVGDMSGFAAACYQRGIDWVQVPTTLLAQVDASVGGKTGVNHSKGKNLIGAFHQPVGVFADTATLDTLAEREYRAGLAEVIKYGLIIDAEFAGWLEEHMPQLLQRKETALVEAIRRSCEIKARIVAADEHERGQRALLNLGHTFGHALETALGYGTWLHGEAVAAGTVLAAELSCRLGLITRVDVERVTRLLAAAQLPVSVPSGTDPAQLRALMGLDKKTQAGRLRLVLLDRIGQARLSSDVPDETLQTLLADACS